MQVSELMTVAVVALPPVVRVRDLVDTLRSCTHQVCINAVVITTSRWRASAHRCTELLVAS